MSAFICHTDHIRALAVFAAHRDHGGCFRVDPRYVRGCCAPYDPTSCELASYYAALLYSENIRSVSARYPNDDFDSLPGLVEKPYSVEISLRDVGTSGALTAVWILKMLDCLDYQSCVTEDWHDTVAYRLVNAIRMAAIRALPGYDKAPWEYSAEGSTEREAA